MATARENLARSLEVLKKLQENGNAAIRTADISKTHRERLIKNGFLKKITNGWYLPVSPGEKPGDTTSWYASYWNFMNQYLNTKLGKLYCLSADHSMQLHSGNWTIPFQLIVRSKRGTNRITKLMDPSSVFLLKLPIPPKTERVEVNGLQVYSPASSLVNCSGKEFTDNPIDARVVLGLIRDSSEVLELLLNGGHSVKAGILAGAFRNIHKNRIADDIIKTMQRAGYAIRELDPFETTSSPAFKFREKSPYENRINVMWQQMRDDVIQHFPKSPGIPKDRKRYLKIVEEIYTTDAYHSLSIERYKVSPELIERVRKGNWNSDPEGDLHEKNKMAARGYWQAFQNARQSLQRILDGENAGEVVDSDYGNWYRELFAPGVAAGIIKASDLAGFRSTQVYIGNSKHVPLNTEAVREAMPAFFELLKQEPEASVRAVLGHFIFVYIHPYRNGNGRMGRFLMNAMLASGGYPWTVIPVESRSAYMDALEMASVEQNIIPFTKFLAHLVNQSVKGKPVAKI